MIKSIRAGHEPARKNEGEERALKHPDTAGRGVAETFPALLLHHAGVRAEKTAIREKYLGRVSGAG